MNGTQVISFPESIINLNDLVEIDANQNQISIIPENICSIPNLSRLYLSDNNLCEEYNYDCIWNFAGQDQSNCCEGPNGEPNWTQCD